ncbi:disease resistance protein RGA2 [Trifolium repens]|nr:disease resistance protein RGA2 [Trifolium repens]
MAEQIPYAVAASLINRLGSAALREYGRINGVMNELERLKKTVESIRAVLLDAEDKQEEQNHAVQNWNMLKSLLPKKKIDDTFSLDNLQSMLRHNLTGKRYLLVLDDIWNDSFEKWDKLRTYLMCGAQGSKVVVTTRSTIVTQTMGVSVPYVLNGLTLEESWSLLKKIAFGNDTIQVDPNIESIAKKIAEKCKGVPLAIRSLGSILQSKSEQKEWNNVLQGAFWKLCETKESLLPVLKLSFNYLLPQQRQCFAYCSLFPKDWEFEKDELIQMWMAHGYLDRSDGKCMEDLGNEFVNNFFMKSFFQEAKLNEDGDIIGFKMHDLMHDLAKQVAGDDYCYLDNNAKGCLGIRPVHVWIEFDALSLLKSLDASRLRTLIVFSPNNNDLLDREKLLIISKFKYLRVLKLCNYKCVGLCVLIEKLKHLRFLDLYRDGVQESFEKFIGNLVCLQTIKVSLDYKAVLSTKVVSKLIKLRCLYFKTGTFRDKTLVGFGKLSMEKHESVIFSKWLSPLTNIIEISLERCQGLRYLPPLERLPFLKSLRLVRIDDLEYIYYEESILPESFFPSLKRLDIRFCSKLVGWKSMRDDFNDINTSSHHLLLPQFPSLSSLEIGECLMLTHMPTFPNIKSLELIRCNGKILEATLNITASQYLIGFPPLSMLKFLKIQDNIKLPFSNKKPTNLDLKTFPQHWLQNLTSLEKLEFQFLSIQHFQAIEIWFKDDINYLPSLQKITFDFCDDLKTLPDWIFNISSLQNIKIS